MSRRPEIQYEWTLEARRNERRTVEVARDRTDPTDEPPSRSTASRRRLAALAAALGLVTLAACSSGDEDGAAAAATSIAESATVTSGDENPDDAAADATAEATSGDAAIEDGSPDDAMSDEAAGDEDQPVETLQMAMLDCGTMEVLDLGAVPTLEDVPDREVTLAVTCWLLRHPDGILLWDLGVPSELAGAPSKTYFAFDVSLTETISSQLTQFGLDSGDVDFVSVSHTHFDHGGQVDQFPNATWLVHEAELARPAFFGPEASAFRSLATETFTTELDVFGDGSIVIFETPGHTPGHTSLQVTLDEAGPILLTGDLYVNAESREHQLMPPFNASVADTLKSMEAFELRAEELDARVVITHDFESIEDLPRPPEVLK